MRLYQVPIPPVCIFSVTHRCNLECQGCYARSRRDGHQPSRDEIGTVIRNVSGYGTSIFVITGGEPLLVPGLVHCLGKQEKCLFYLFSNGTLFESDAIQQLRHYRNIMPVISYEGNDVITDLRRGSGTALKIRKTLKALPAISGGFSDSCPQTIGRPQRLQSARSSGLPARRSPGLPETSR